MTKKIIAALALVLIVAGGVFGQSEGGKTWYNSFAPGVDDNRVFINGGIGFGLVGGYNLGFPPLSVSVDVKLTPKFPITLGGLFAYSQWKWSYLTADLRWHNIGFGVRGMYHFNFFRNLDTYAGLTLGYVIQSFDDNGFDLGLAGYGADPFFLFGANIGARYFFTKNIGAYLELGYSGLQFVGFGLSVKI
jgi:hypothetical protein